jgi:hypothetical protein
MLCCEVLVAAFRLDVQSFLLTVAGTVFVFAAIALALQGPAPFFGESVWTTQRLSSWPHCRHLFDGLFAFGCMHFGSIAVLIVVGSTLLFANTAAVNLSIMASVPAETRPFTIGLSTLMIHVFGEFLISMTGYKSICGLALSRLFCDCSSP